METSYRSVRAVVLYFALVLMFIGISGCSSGGGSDSDFFSSTPSGAAGTGATAPVVASQPTLTFKFVQGQTALTVPTNTTQVKFAFFASDNGVGAPLFEVVRPYANSITIELDDDRARSVTVTALDVNSVPVLESTVAIPTGQVQDFEIDFADTDPVLVTVNSITITPDEGILSVGVAQNLSATLNFSNGTSMPGDAVTWSVTGQATITSDGVLTGTESGEAFVTAEYSGVEGEATFTVGDGPSLSSLVVTPSGTVYWPPDDFIDFIVEGRDQNGNPIDAGAYTLQIVTNNSKGSLDGQKTGYFTGSTEATDTLRISAGGLSVLQDIIVGDDPALTIDFLTVDGPNPLTLTAPGQTSSVTATATFLDTHQETLPNLNFNLFFSSANSNVATVSPSGVVTAVAQGSTNITARATGASDILSLTVDYGANNAEPIVVLGSDVLQFRNEFKKLAPSATVSDDQIDFDGGKLIISQLASGDVTDAQFQVPGNAPNIGTVTATDTRIEVELNSNATPASVQTFLRSLSIRRHDTSGRGTVNVELQDRDANDPNVATGTGSRNFESVITVGTGGRYATIAAAVGAAENHTSMNPIFLLYADDFDETVFCGAGFDSWTFYGPNQGVSAGVQAAGTTPPTRVAEATVQAFQALNTLLILDGLTVDGPDSGTAITVFEVGGVDSRVDVSNCRFVGRDINAVTIATEIAPECAGDFTDCFFGNWSLPLLITNPSHSPEILRNRFEGNFRSIDLRYLTTSVTIVGNSFHEALQSDLSPGYHLFVEDGSTPGQFATAVFAPGDISGNDFTGNGRVYNSAQGVDLVVEGNWWGQAGGPLATQTEVSGTAPIDVDPAASTPFTNGSTTPLD